MTGDPLNCSILALRAKGDRSLAHSLAGLDVLWMTARDGYRPGRLSHDLYLVAGSVSVDDALGFYRHVRAGEPNVPIILISADSSAELPDRLATDPASYLVMNGELTHVRLLVHHVMDGIKARLMDARMEELRTLTEELSERQRRLGERNGHLQRRLASSDWLAMRKRSMSFFTRRGGTATQFERLWPGLCAEALGAIRETS